MICGVCRSRPGLIFRWGLCTDCGNLVRALFANRYRLRAALKEAGC